MHGYLVTQLYQVFAYQSVTVEVAYQVLHYHLLSLRERVFVHLVMQEVIKRLHLWLHPLFLSGIRIAVVGTLVVRGFHTIVPIHHGESLIKFIASLFLLVAIIIILVIVNVKVIVIVIIFPFESRIFIHLRLHVLLQLCNRHLQQVHRHHLLCAEPLLLLLYELLLLYLCEPLCHFTAKLLKNERRTK